MGWDIDVHADTPISGSPDAYVEHPSGAVSAAVSLVAALRSYLAASRTGVVTATIGVQPSCAPPSPASLPHLLLAVTNESWPSFPSKGPNYHDPCCNSGQAVRFPIGRRRTS